MGLASLGFARIVKSSFDDAVAAVRTALTAEGFYVASEIDVRANLKEKLGVEIPQCLILGAFNAALTHRALIAERNVTLLLPRNIVVSETDSGTMVRAANIQALVDEFDNVVLGDVAHEISTRMQRIVERI